MMKLTTALPACLLALALLLAAGPAQAEDYVCKGERIEKGSSTWGYARTSGSDYRIEKGSSSIAWVRSAGSAWRIETFGGSTLGWLKGDRIESSGGSTIARLSDAKLLCDCPAPVAAALYVLKREGKL